MQRDPFRLGADHTFSYAHKSYSAALTYLKFAAYREEGFVMITGKPGTGKTTLISEILAGLNPDKVVTATLVTTRLESYDLLHMMADAFGIETNGANKSTLLLRIQKFLVRNHEDGRRTILLVDEAQGLTLDAIEELRQLSNLVANGNPMLQTFLIGQDELRDLVKSPQLDQLRQRIVASSHLEPLGVDDVFGYVRHRLLEAGWTGDPKIANSVIRLVHYYSNGIPRKINLICGRLLLHGFTEGKHTLLREDMEAVIDELGKELLIFDEDAAPAEAQEAEAGSGFLEVNEPGDEDPSETGETINSPGEEDADTKTAPEPGAHEQEVTGPASEPDIPAPAEQVSGPDPETDTEQEQEARAVSLPPQAATPPARKVNYLGAVLLLLVLVLLLLDGKYRFHQNFLPARVTANAPSAILPPDGVSGGPDTRADHVVRDAPKPAASSPPDTKPPGEY